MNNLHHTKPTIGQWVYFISPNGCEVLGQYLAINSFNASEGNLKGYCAKYWRELTDVEVESLGITAQPITNKPKRPYIKKVNV